MRCGSHNALASSPQTILTPFYKVPSVLDSASSAKQNACQAVVHQLETPLAGRHWFLVSHRLTTGLISEDKM